MKRYAITHETHYAYDLPVTLGLHTARMSPVAGQRQKLVEHRLDIVPQPDWSVVFTDHFGNSMHHIAIQSLHNALTVTQKAVVEVATFPWDILPSGPSWETIRDCFVTDAFPDEIGVVEFTYPSPLIPLDKTAETFAREAFIPGAPIAHAALELARRFKEEFAYVPGTTTVTTSVAEIVAERRGVCQDFAHAMIAGLRGLGLPARYVSGYLKTYRATDTMTEMSALVGADASHAWVSLWCGSELGWLEFDPTNALAVKDEHIAIAYGRDFSDVTPLRGVINGGGNHTLTVAVSVELLPHSVSG